MENPEKNNSTSRRTFVKSSVYGAGALLANSAFLTNVASGGEEKKGASDSEGAQRLSVKRLKEWGSWGYGLFIHFGLSTFVEKEVPYGYDSPMEYAPKKLDVDQWVRVARDSGMKYAVLTAKHCSGHCLWPSKCTDYTVENSRDTTDVVRQFVDACRKYNIKPGLYYNCYDTHHRFGSQTLLDLKPSSVSGSYPRGNESLAPYTSSIYQNFMKDQLTELLTQYGPIDIIWIDNPAILGVGYRFYLYHYMAGLQPDAIIMMANYMEDGSNFDVSAAWPSELVPIKATLPPPTGHQPWRTIHDKRYYMPGEVCVPIGKNWFYIEGEIPRKTEELVNDYLTIRKRNSNLLLNVPPDKSGMIPRVFVEALSGMKRRLRL